MRKVYVTLTVKAIINMNDDVELDEVIADMDYNFASQTTGADIHNTDIENYEVTDSK